MTSKEYGYPYYNTSKPPSYIIGMFESKIRSIESEIRKLEFEKMNIQKDMDNYIKKQNNHGK